MMTQYNDDPSELKQDWLKKGKYDNGGIIIK